MRNFIVILSRPLVKLTSSKNLYFIIFYVGAVKVGIQTIIFLFTHPSRGKLTCARRGRTPGSNLGSLNENWCGLPL